MEELWRYRELLAVFIWREVRIKYTSTLLGPFWLLFQSIFTSGVFFIVFAKILRVPSDGINPILFYLSGLLVWSYFSNTLQAISMMLVANAGLFKKIYFPRLLLPLAHCAAGSVGVGFQLLLFAFLYLAYAYRGEAGGEGLSPFLPVFPLVFLQVAALSFGLGLWVAALTVRYRDFHHLLGLGLNVLLYLTPIAYPVSGIEPRYRVWLELNPLWFPVETLRLLFFQRGTWDPGAVLLNLLVTLVIVLSGLLYFRHVEADFVDAL